MRRMKKSIVIYILLTAAATYFLFPFFWMVIISLKQQSEVYASPPSWLPGSPTFNNFITAFTEGLFPFFFLNSVVVSTIVTIITVSLAFFAAYGFSRFDFKLKKILFLAILIGQLLPGAVRFIPLYLIFVKTALVNTRSALIITYVGWVLPFSTLMLRGYLSSVPLELEESAKIDGYSRFQTLYKIVLPLAAPGVAATLIFAFVNCWQEFLFGLVLIQETIKNTLPVGLMYFKGEFNISWGKLMAATSTAVLPVTILFIVFQRTFTAGLTKGALKQ